MDHGLPVLLRAEILFSFLLFFMVMLTVTRERVKIRKGKLFAEADLHGTIFRVQIIVYNKS